MKKPELLLFVKYPEPGRVKTRLIPLLGPDKAARLYRCFVKDILETVRQAGFSPLVFFTPGQKAREMEQWLGPGLPLYPQEGPDLGARMASAFERVFRGKTKQALLIGSDIPDLPADILDCAADGLDGNDAVLGPARDGGYYLIGFNKKTYLKEVFSGPRWGGPKVFDATMEIFRTQGKKVRVLPLWQDVDTPEDLKDLAARAEKVLSAAPSTLGMVRGLL